MSLIFQINDDRLTQIGNLAQSHTKTSSNVLANCASQRPHPTDSFGCTNNEHAFVPKSLND